SAPVSFTSDNTPPTSVSGSVTGTAGTIRFDGSATDTTGIGKIQFFVDGVIRASDATAPYSTFFNSTVLTNGSHTMTVRAFDIAGNSTDSSPISFTVSN
ncbi:MAG TPA: Ig-like domain-containing protein, partial [Holophagaceae bacterium]|nr:Ig-like domain-containing protein [Holophagaceae bacterium]